MSKYDKDREKLGIRSTSTSNTAIVNTSSKYANDRELIASPSPYQSHLSSGGSAPPMDVRQSKLLKTTNEAPKSKVSQTQLSPYPGRGVSEDDIRNESNNFKALPKKKQKELAKTVKKSDKKLDSDLNKGINSPLANRIMKPAAEFVTDFTNKAGLGIPLAIAGDTRADYEKTIAGKLGSLAGEIAPISRAYNLVNPLTKGITNTLARTATRGAIVGTGYGTAKELADMTLDTREDGSQSIGRRAGNVATDAGLFAAGDAAIVGVGKLLSPVAKRLFDRFKNQGTAPAEQQVPEMLAREGALETPRAQTEIITEAPELAKIGSLELKEAIAPTKLPLENKLNPHTKLEQKYLEAVRKSEQYDIELERKYAGKDKYPILAGWKEDSLHLQKHSAKEALLKKGYTEEAIERLGEKQISESLLPQPKADPGKIDNSPLSTPKLSEMGKTTSEPSMPTQIPKVEDVQKLRGFAETLLQSEKPPQGFKEKIDFAYKPMTNKDTVDAANIRVNRDRESAHSYVMGKERFTPEKVTTGHRLIDEYNKAGQYQRAVDVAEKLAEEGTKHGQAIQAYSIFNRLTPEGILIHATRIAKKTNENLPLTAKEVKVTNKMAEQITDLAQTTQRMTGVKELSNDVMNILERVKGGKVVTDPEKQTLQQFVNDAKQFVKETTRKVEVPREIKIPKNKQVREKLVSFLDLQEQAAKDRLRNKGIQVSSMPLDIYADYAIIGAAKMAKGTVKFADWSERMIKELGEEIKPYMHQLYDRASETFNVSTKKITQSNISRAEKIANQVIKNKGLKGEEAEYLSGLAQKVSGLSGDAKLTASQDLQLVLQQLERPGLWRKVDTAQTISQLWNPKTHIRNVVGNEMFYRLERLNKYVSTPIDFATSKITGRERVVTFRRNNQGEYWKSFLTGAKAGWKGTNPEGLTTQFDLKSQTFKGKYNPMTYLEKSLGASLKGFDYAAYKRAYNETIGELATLRVMNEGQKGNKELINKYVREADENIMAIADEYGRYTTFQDNNPISRALQATKGTLNKITTGSKDFGLGSIVLKYPKTPGALLMRAIEYSPAGFVRSAYLLSEPFLKQGARAETREVINSLSRTLVGTGVIGMAYFLADVGILTGEASKDRDIRALETSSGKGNYRVNLSALKRWALSGFDKDEAKTKENDTLYSYDWAQPIAFSLSIGANVANSLKERDSAGETLKGVGITAFDSITSGVDTLTDQSVLQGLKQFAQGYPGQSIMDKITDTLLQMPSSFSPTLLNQINHMNDNASRETYDPSKLQQSLNQVKVRVPGLAQQLPQRHGTLGQPRERFQNKSNTLFNVFLNPGFVNKYLPDKEEKMIADLIDRTGDTSVAPRVPNRSITVHENGKPVSKKLTTEQFAKLQELQGKETARLLKLVPEEMPDDVKLKMIAAMLTDAGQRAREQLKMEMGSH